MRSTRSSFTPDSQPLLRKQSTNLEIGQDGGKGAIGPRLASLSSRSEIRKIKLTVRTLAEVRVGIITHAQGN